MPLDIVRGLQQDLAGLIDISFARLFLFNVHLFAPCLRRLLYHLFAACFITNSQSNRDSRIKLRKGRRAAAFPPTLNAFVCLGDR